MMKTAVYFTYLELSGQCIYTSIFAPVSAANFLRVRPTSSYRLRLLKSDLLTTYFRADLFTDLRPLLSPNNSINAQKNWPDKRKLTRKPS